MSKYIFASYDNYKNAPIPRLIWRDYNTSWDKSHYDFGHCGRQSVNGHRNYKAKYL